MPLTHQMQTRQIPMEMVLQMYWTMMMTTMAYQIRKTTSQPIQTKQQIPMGTDKEIMQIQI